MGNSVPVPERPLVPEGKTRICVAGFGLSHNTGRARNLAAAIADAYPDKYETWFYFSTLGYGNFLKDFQEKELPEEFKDKSCSMDTKPKTFATQTSAPLVWFEIQENGSNKIEMKGGRDLFAQWAGTEFPDHDKIQPLTGVESPPIKELFYENSMPQGTYQKK